MRGKLGLRSFVLLGSILAISLILAPVHAEARNIKVGIIDCYSGPAAVFCIDALNGLSVTFFRWSFYAAFLIKYSSGYLSFGNMLPYNRFLSSILCASQ